MDDYYRALGKIMWDEVGMARSDAGLKKAIDVISKLRKEFWTNLKVGGDIHEINKNLEMAGRVADFLELGELMARDALHREESCGGHFRIEHQTKDGEAKRNDEKFSYVAAWEYKTNGNEHSPVLHKEELVFDNVHLAERNYA